ncbi:MAG: hypothetical protein ACE5JF_13580 [Anaerolineales bacterium]
MPSVLFVCTANLCRSPMAAALFRDLLAKSGLAEAWQVESAGTWGFDGYPAMPQTQVVLQERGLDVRQHRSRRVSAELLRPFDLILVMERGQREALRIEFPELAHRVHMLTELSCPPYSVPEPFENEPAEYRELRDELAELLERGFGRLVELAEARNAFM